MKYIDYKAVIEIIENFLNNKKVEILGISVGEEHQLRTAIENILKERQADKEKIKELEKYETYYQNERNLLDSYISKTLIEEEINRLKYDVSKIKEIKQTRYSDYDRIRLKAYVTKSNEIIKRLEKCVNKR